MEQKADSVQFDAIFQFNRRRINKNVRVHLNLFLEKLHFQALES